MMRRVLIGAGALVLVVVLALALAPALVGPAPLVRELERRGLELTGLPLAIDGPVSWSLLPAPAVQASGLHVANLAGGTARDLGSIARVEARLAFWPLLTGRIEVESLVIQQPVLNLEILADGRRNWVAPPPAPAATPPGPAAPPRQPSPVALRQIEVRGGTASFLRAGRRLEAADLSLDARGDLVPLGPGLLIPWQTTGSLHALGLKLGLSVLLSRPVPSGLPVKLTLDLADPPGALIHGTLDAVEAAGGVSGAFEVSMARPRDLVARLGGAGLLRVPDRVLSLVSHPMRLSGWLRTAGDLVDMTGFEAAVGGLRAAGRVAVPLGAPARADVDLAFGPLDAGTLQAPASGTVVSTVREASPAPPTVPMAQPDGRFHLLAPRVVWRGHVLRDVVLAGRTRPGAGGTFALPAEVEVTRASAGLPGDGRISVQGTLTSPGAAPRFAGRVDGQVPDLRTLLASLGYADVRVEAGRFASASLGADVALSRDTLIAKGLALRVDATTLTGTLTASRGDRPAVTADLHLDDVNLDGYLTAPAAPVMQSPPSPTGSLPMAGPPAPAQAQPLPARQTPASSTVLGRVLGLKAIDADLSIGADHLLWRGAGFSGVRLNLTNKAGVAMLRAGVASALGGTAAVAGTLTYGAPGLPSGALTIDGSGEDLGRVARALPVALTVALPPSLDLSGPFKLHAAVDATPLYTTGALDLAALGGSLHAQLSAQLFSRLSGSVTLQHPDFAALIARLTRRYRPLETGPLSLSVDATTLPADDWRITRFSAHAGSSDLTGSGSVVLKGAPTRFAAALTTTHLDLDRLLPLPAMPFTRTLDLRNLHRVEGQATLGGGDVRWGGLSLSDVRLSAATASGTLTVKALTGRLIDGALSASGSATANVTAGEPASLALQVALRDGLWTADRAPLPLLQPALTLQQGRFDLAADLRSRGVTVRDLVAGITGTLLATARQGAIAGLDLGVIDRSLGTGDVATVPASALNRGETPFATAMARLRFSNGSVSLDRAALDGPQGSVMAIGSLDLVTQRIATRLALTLPGRESTPGLRLDGPLAQPSFAADGASGSTATPER